MRLALVLLAPILSGLLACSAVGFQPAECQSLSIRFHEGINDRMYRDLIRGTYDSGDCFRFAGQVVQSIEGGYRVDTEGWGTSYPGDVYVRWEGDYRFVEGDRVVVTGAVVEPLTFETPIGTERTIPAFHGSDMLDMEQHNKQVAATREVIEMQEAATRQIIEVTKQAEYRADYKQRSFNALKEVASCRITLGAIIYDRLQRERITHDSLVGRHTTPKIFIGPAPDNIGPDTAPNILVEGYYTVEKRDGDQSCLPCGRGQVTARWTGRDCVFRDFQFYEGVWPTPTPKPTNTPDPTKDPNAPEPTNTLRPTYTPWPTPTRR